LTQTRKSKESLQSNFIQGNRFKMFAVFIRALNLSLGANFIDFHFDPNLNARKTLCTNYYP
jgi:hypothetical protein